MAQPSFEAFFWAIATQESGHNYKAVGPATKYGHAYGKYQVLEPNVGPWTQKYYGKWLTPQQFLNNPQAQEAVAKGQLKAYYNKYGAKGAAAMWYSGQPDPTKSYGNPPVYKYVSDVMGHAANYKGGGGSSSSSSASYSSASEDKPLARNEQAELYGFVEGLLDSNKELRKLFDKAVKGQWTTEKFQAELRDTKWFKTTSQSEREFLVLKFGDPKTADQKLDQAYVKVRQLAAQLGIVESPALLKKMNTWAYNMVAKGWDEAQMRYEIGKYVTFGTHLQGEGGEIQMQLRELAYDMGVTMSTSWYADKTRAVLRGIATVQDYEDAIRKQAAALYPQFKKQIDAGQTVAEIASPYIQSMQTILEIPAGSISVQDKLIKSALQNKDKTTGANAVMPLWQFENQLREDPRWKKTQNAQNSMMQVAHQVLSDFGVAY